MEYLLPVIQLILGKFDTRDKAPLYKPMINTNIIFMPILGQWTKTNATVLKTPVYPLDTLTLPPVILTLLHP